MDEHGTRFRQPWLWMSRHWRAKVAISLAAATAILLVVLYRHAVVVASTIQVLTYLEDEAPGYSPVDEGDSVCLTGVVEPIGKIESLRHLGRRLEIVMSVDKRYQAKIPADSVTLLTVSWEGPGRCGFGRRMRFLEIDTTEYGRCFERKPCRVSDVPITNRAVLQASYRLYCGEEGVGCGGVVEFVYHPWWRRAIDHAVDFVEIDIGVIYIELFAAIMAVIVGVTILALRFAGEHARE